MMCTKARTAACSTLLCFVLFKCITGSINCPYKENIFTEMWSGGTATATIKPFVDKSFTRLLTNCDYIKNANHYSLTKVFQVKDEECRPTTTCAFHYLLICQFSDWLISSSLKSLKQHRTMVQITVSASFSLTKWRKACNYECQKYWCINTLIPHV